MPASFVVQLAHALERAGGDRGQLMAELGVSEDTLTEPERRVALHEGLAIVERAAALSSWSGLTMALGMAPSVTRFGPVGFASIACASVREALEVSVQYASLITSAVRLHLHCSGERAVLEAEQVHSLGVAGWVILPALLMALWRSGETFTGKTLVGDVDFSMPEPPDFAQYAGVAPGVVRFSQPRDRLLFDRSYLDLPLLTADPGAARSMREQCERMLVELTSSATLVQRVQRALFADDGSLCSAREVARQLALSERTLKRRLAEQGTSYTELLDTARHNLALELLRSEASVEEMAERLGYSDAANFTRAFRRWTGRSPRAARKASS